MPDEGQYVNCAVGLANIRIGDHYHLAQVKWIGREWGCDVRFKGWISPEMEHLARRRQGNFRIEALDEEDFDEALPEPSETSPSTHPADWLMRPPQL